MLYVPKIHLWSCNLMEKIGVVFSRLLFAALAAGMCSTLGINVFLGSHQVKQKILPAF